MEIPQSLSTVYLPESTRYLGLSGLLERADEVALAAFIILMLMSVATWYFILEKGMRIWQLRRRAGKVMMRLWTAESLTQALAELDRGHSTDMFTELLRQGIDADRHYRHHCSEKLGQACSYSEFIAEALRQSIATAAARLEGGLTLLASIGSTAPFVGLFGTVWSIYHALIRISQSAQATLDQVAGPVGEALIMTAFGLAAAVPAVLAYNALVRANRVMLMHLDRFAYDLHTYLTTGARVEHQQDVSADQALRDRASTSLTQEAL